MMTPRIRSIKPELFSHEGLFEAEQDYQLPLRLAFIALITCCDREGRFRWQPRRLKLDMLPYDDVDISKVLEAFITRGFIKKYQNQGQDYGCIPSWHRHQRINHREADSELPPIEDCTEIEETNLNSNSQLQVIDASVIDASTTRVSSVPHALRACPGGREEEEKRSEGEEKRSIVASETRLSVEPLQIKQVFEHWKTVMEHPNAKLDDKRRVIIGKALKSGYSASELCDAITGCRNTPYNMGDNERGQRYDGLHVILRDGDQIDRFIHNCLHPPRIMTEADRRRQANAQALQTWMQETLAQETVHGNA